MEPPWGPYFTVKVGPPLCMMGPVMIKTDHPNWFPPGTNFLINMDPPELILLLNLDPLKYLDNPRNNFFINMDPPELILLLNLAPP